MTGALTSFLPPWLNPNVLIGAGAGIAGLGAGIFLTHAIEQSSKLRAIQVERDKTHELQMRYDGYKQGVAASAAQTNAKTLAERTGLERQISALQTQLIESQRIANAKSAQLRQILASAPPGSAHPLSDAAMQYLDGLRRQSP